MRPDWGLVLPTLVLSLAALAGGGAPADSRVLVMPFAAVVEPDAPGGAGAALWLGEAAAVLMADGLEARGIGVITRDERADAFDRLGLPVSSALTRATTLRIAELMGATDVVFGDVHVGSRLAVRARLVSVAEGRELPAVTGEEELAALFPFFDQLAGTLAGRTGYALTSESVRPAPLPLEVFEDYVKGLVAATPDAQRRFLEDAMVQAPHDGRVMTALWQVYTTVGAHDLALETASATPSESPLFRKARFAVALSLIALGRFDGALIELEALGAASARPAVANAAGVARLRRRVDGWPATEAFTAAVELAPGNTTYLFNLGYGFALAGNAERALFWLRETVRYDAADGAAHLVMSAVLAGQGRRVEAGRELDLARVLGTPFDPATVELDVSVPAGLERLPTSLDLDTDYRRTAIANPDARDQQETAAFHLGRARRLIDSRQDREAADELRRAIYLAPYEDEPHLLLGAIYQRGGRLPDAIDEFTVALWCRETAAGHVALGAALFETGALEEARRAAERALALDPGSTDARTLLDRIGRTTGRETPC